MLSPTLDRPLEDLADEAVTAPTHYEPLLTDEAGKAAAVALYVHGLTTLEQTAAAFARHPGRKQK